MEIISDESFIFDVIFVKINIICFKYVIIIYYDNVLVFVSICYREEVEWYKSSVHFYNCIETTDPQYTISYHKLLSFIFSKPRFVV